MKDDNKLYVCQRCLWAIVSKEGRQPILTHDVELEEISDICDWCGEDGNTELYELL